MRVALVGAGPGDPGLLTLKGRALLAEADVVVYDALANPELLEFARPDAELIYVGKIAGRHALPQDEINALLAARARQNKTVVRLKGGDPYIFGRGGEEGLYLAEQGIPFEEVPGISSAIAAPAYAGIPLTHRDFVSSVCIVTGHEHPDKADSFHNWHALAQSGSTLVFVMGVKNLPGISEKLIAAGMPATTPAAIIYRGTTPAQRCLCSTLGALPEEAVRLGFTNPSVVVIGQVVGLHESLDWFAKKPLLGKRIIVTRARTQASELAASLARLGAQVIQCPTIKIVPVQDQVPIQMALEKLPEYDWLIFTSANGVEHFMNLLQAHHRDVRALGNAKLAVIGPATRDALARYGLRADLAPDSYVAEDLAGVLMARENIAGAKILIPRAKIARDVLPAMLEEAGAIVDVAPVYETIMGQGNESVRTLLENGQVDCVTFASSSTVRNFLTQYPSLSCPPLIASIGPITTKTIRDAGLEAHIQPEEYTITALVRAICQYYTGQKEC